MYKLDEIVKVSNKESEWLFKVVQVVNKNNHYEVILKGPIDFDGPPKKISIKGNDYEHGNDWNLN